MNCLVLSIDGLHLGMIGAMGNGWIQTPAFDRLAAQSVVFDRFYAETLDLPSIFSVLWSDSPPGPGLHTTLLTDDTDVFHHALAADFTERHRIEEPPTDRPAGAVEDTRFFRLLASTVDLWERHRRRGVPPEPSLLWTHCQGFRGVWDFPDTERQRHRGEDDPEPYGGVRAPETEWSGEIDPDELQAVMEAYAGGMAVLDAALAGLLDWLEEDDASRDTLLILLASRGFSLGEHGRIGADRRLYAENVQLPLFVRFPDGFEAASRCPELLQTRDLAAFLNTLPDGFEKNDSRLAASIREETESAETRLRIAGEEGEAAIVTPDWFLRRSPATHEDGFDAADARRYELYVKPDDRWEINDVADRCPEVVAELARR